MEHVNSITIRVAIDTNKDTYSGRFDSIDEFIEWWNEHKEYHGQPIQAVTYPDE